MRIFPTLSVKFSEISLFPTTRLTFGTDPWGVGATLEGTYPLAPFLQERGICSFNYCSLTFSPSPGHLVIMSPVSPYEIGYTW